MRLPGLEQVYLESEHLTAITIFDDPLAGEMLAVENALPVVD
jgi:hypothetical protein